MSGKTPLVKNKVSPWFLIGYEDFTFPTQEENNLKMSQPEKVQNRKRFISVSDGKVKYFKRKNGFHTWTRELTHPRKNI